LTGRWGRPPAARRRRPGAPVRVPAGTGRRRGGVGPHRDPGL